MGNDWIGGQLGDFVQIGSSKRIFYKEYVPEGVPFYRSKEVIEKSSRKNVSTELYILHNRFKEIKEKFGVPQKGDILLTSVGTLGVPWVVDTDEDFYFKDGNLTWFKDFHPRLNNHFLFYWLVSPIGKNELEMSSIGSTQPALTIKGLKELSISIPPIEEQIAIIGVLSALDDKIDLLQRQNRTLESLAQALFRHWFSDGAGEDWEEKPLDAIATFLNGLACQKYPPENEIDRLPVLKIKDLRSGLSEQSDWATSDVPEEYIVENGDVVFSWSGSLMVKIWDGNNCVLNQHLFKVTSEQYPKWFYYFWTVHHLQKFIAIAESKATTMGHIKRADLSSSMTFIPAQAELDEMDQSFAPLIDKIVLNNQQIASLTALRDTLLPKLMSGEVRVRV